jgi:serine/threonine-protein kinase
MRIAPTHAALVAALCASLTARRAASQDTEATATALFDEGRKLMSQQKYAEACPKLAQSEHLAPSGGTLINLAECYERIGKTASAWAAWKDAAARANAVGKSSVEKTAVARSNALEPSLARLTIAVARESDVPGIQVKRDGVPVVRDEFGSALPVDPGSHVVEATAPGKKAWSASVDVAAKQTDARVTISLADDVSASPAPPAAIVAPTATNSAVVSPRPEANGGSSQKTIAIVVGGAGVVVLGVGAVFGLEAKSQNDQALQNCRTPTLCSQKGLSLTDDARNSATIADVAFGVGAAAVAAGAVLWLTAPHASTAGLRAVPVVARAYGGLAIDAAW